MKKRIKIRTIQPFIRYILIIIIIIHSFLYYSAIEVWFVTSTF